MSIPHELQAAYDELVKQLAEPSPDARLLTTIEQLVYAIRKIPSAFGELQRRATYVEVQCQKILRRNVPVLEADITPDRLKWRTSEERRNLQDIRREASVISADGCWWMLNGADPEGKAKRSNPKSEPAIVRAILQSELGYTHFSKIRAAADAMIGWIAEHAIRDAAKPSTTGDETPVAPTIWFHAERQYSIDRATPFKVTDEHDSILQVFLRSQAAMETRDITDKAGVTNPSRAIQELSEWSDGIFKAAIRIPKGKAKGGYFIRVKSL